MCTEFDLPSIEVVPGKARSPEEEGHRPAPATPAALRAGRRDARNDHGDVVLEPVSVWTALTTGSIRAVSARLPLGRLTERPLSETGGAPSEQYRARARGRL
jgi:hypothetical protein